MILSKNNLDMVLTEKSRSLAWYCNGEIYYAMNWNNRIVDVIPGNLLHKKVGHVEDVVRDALYVDWNQRTKKGLLKNKKN